MGGGGVVDSYQGLGEGTGGGYYLIVFVSYVFVFCCLTFSQSLLYLGG